MEKIFPIAYYLPQFHRLKFNDDYWGKGFTEWTNTVKAKPLFKGHYQPHIPADLGFYDLSVASSRREQAALAQQYGVGGFCYWHYWFRKNEEVMEMPFKEVLKDDAITLPFCLAWANHDWHDVKTREIIIKQEYGGLDDYKAHYNSISSAFHDKRYISHEGRPIFVVFSPFEIPDAMSFINYWQDLAKEDQLPGIYFIAIVKRDWEIEKALQLGFDAVNIMRLQEFEFQRGRLTSFIESIKHKYLRKPYVYDFRKAMRYFVSEKDKEENVIPTIISGWDHTPRSGMNALVLDRFSPSVFSEHIKEVFSEIEVKDNKLVFIRAWNEWAEGNHLEPDLKYGLGYLEALYSNLLLFNGD